jgi:hypothetical protein
MMQSLLEKDAAMLERFKVDKFQPFLLQIFIRCYR